MHIPSRALSCFVALTTFLALATISATAQAGVIEIGPMMPFPAIGVTSGIRGLAFDGTPNALVMDRWTWAIDRVSVQDASVLESGGGSVKQSASSSQLIYDPASGDFYSIENHMSLARINGQTHAKATVGPIGEFFNFVGLGIDPAGDLWLGVDRGGPELWRINKATGAGTLQTNIQMPPQYQLTSFMVDPSGMFVMYARSSWGEVGARLRVDPATGATSFLTSGVPSTSGYLAEMDYDPYTGRYFGIYGGSGLNILVEITGVPEPSSIALAGTALMGLVACGWRKRRARANAPQAT